MVEFKFEYKRFSDLAKWSSYNCPLENLINDIDGSFFLIDSNSFFKNCISTILISSVSVCMKTQDLLIYCSLKAVPLYLGKGHFELGVCANFFEDVSRLLCGAACWDLGVMSAITPVRNQVVLTIHMSGIF
jgi:hypothetical protein